VLALCAAVLAPACGPGIKGTPSEPILDCGDVKGAWRASFGTSCGQSATALQVTVTQANCDFETTVQNLGHVKGTIAKGSADVTVEFPPPCGGTAKGSATVGASRIDAAFAGMQTGTGACCAVVSGTLSLSR
jgi:hypothetical protein